MVGYSSMDMNAHCITCQNVGMVYSYMDDYLTDEALQSHHDERDEDILLESLERPELFEYIVERYNCAFLRKAQYILKSREEAEDTVQDAFAKIYLYAHKFKEQEGASFKSWAYKILINTALTRYQKQKKLRQRTADLDPEFYEILPDKVSQFEDMEVYDYVVQTLERIPETLRKALEMHFLKGLSQQEIADEEGTSVGAIKTRVHRAKEAFREATREE